MSGYEFGNSVFSDVLGVSGFGFFLPFLFFQTLQNLFIQVGREFPLPLLVGFPKLFRRFQQFQFLPLLNLACLRIRKSWVGSIDIPGHVVLIDDLEAPCRRAIGLVDTVSGHKCVKEAPGVFLEFVENGQGENQAPVLMPPRFQDIPDLNLIPTTFWRLD